MEVPIALYCAARGNEHFLPVLCVTYSTAKALDAAQDFKTFCTYDTACVRSLDCPRHVIPTNYIPTRAEDPFIHELGPRCIKN